MVVFISVVVLQSIDLIDWSVKPSTVYIAVCCNTENSKY